MRAIVAEMPAHWLEERRRLGVDRYDEMWDGVLHVNPVPSNPHQDLRDDLLGVLTALAYDASDRGRWRTERNLARAGGWPDDFRIPDLVFLAGGTAAHDRRTHLEGPPEIVVEIADPRDESREKLPWYAALGVDEVWLIDVAARRPEILLRSGDRYHPQPPGPARWIRSEAFEVELRAGRGTLDVRQPGQRRIRARL